MPNYSGHFRPAAGEPGATAAGGDRYLVTLDKSGAGCGAAAAMEDEGSLGFALGRTRDMAPPDHCHLRLMGHRTNLAGFKANPALALFNVASVRDSQRAAVVLITRALAVGADPEDRAGKGAGLHLG